MSYEQFEQALQHEYTKVENESKVKNFATDKIRMEHFKRAYEKSGLLGVIASVFSSLDTKEAKKEGLGLHTEVIVVGVWVIMRELGKPTHAGVIIDRVRQVQKIMDTMMEAYLDNPETKQAIKELMQQIPTTEHYIR